MLTKITTSLWAAATAVLLFNTPFAAPAHADPFLKTPRISTALSVPGSEIWINMMPVIDPEMEPKSFEALFTLINRSGSDIAFELISHCGEKNPVQFILSSEAGEVIWKLIRDDLLRGCPDYLEKRVLLSNKTFHFKVRIPLRVDGQPLKPGNYRLEAHVDGTPEYGAYAPLRIGHAY